MKSGSSRSTLLLAGVCMLAGWSSADLEAAPYKPADDRTVLERLPVRPTDPVQRELKALRRAVEAAPGEPRPAVDLAERYFELAHETGDLRYIGYAEAAVARWRQSTSVPVPVLVIQAQLVQYRHDFAAALKLLDAAIALEPSHVRAHAWRASINMVIARYDAVRPDCERLRALGEKLLATGCAAYLDGTLGKAATAYDTLAAQFNAEPDARSTLRHWTQTVLAELARRKGDAAASERHYKALLKADESDQYVLAAYSELLAHQNRWQDIVALLRKWERSDMQLLQLARAERHLGAPEARAHAATLRARFTDATLRGDIAVTAQEEAWFRLEFEKDPKGALELALRNWAIQKEPRDAEIVLATAIAARDPAAAKPALDWMAQTGIEDPRLAELAAVLGKIAR